MIRIGDWRGSQLKLCLFWRVGWDPRSPDGCWNPSTLSFLKPSFECWKSKAEINTLMNLLRLIIPNQKVVSSLWKDNEDMKSYIYIPYDILYLYIYVYIYICFFWDFLRYNRFGKMIFAYCFWFREDAELSSYFWERRVVEDKEARKMIRKGVRGGFIKEISKQKRLQPHEVHLFFS